MVAWRAGAVFGAWLVCTGTSLAACGSDGSAAPDVPPFGSDAPPAMSAAPTPEGAAPNPSGAEAPGDGQPGPGDPSQPSAEGIDDGVPIDPGMTSGSSGDGAASGAEGDPPDSPAGTEPQGTNPESNANEPPSDGSEPAPDGAAPAPLQPITIWIAGDSTVANGNTPCPRGWGGAFAPHFNERVTVRNSAVGGRSVHTWLYEVQTVTDETGECALNRDASGEPVLQARWQTMLDGMRAGDYLFIQFGINDGDPTCDRHVGIDAFRAAYGMMAAAAKERGAHPIFLTPVSMVRCNGSTAIGSRGGFVPATVEAGQQFDVPVIDLHALSVELFQSLAFCPIPGGDVSAATTGPVGDFFCDDHTHFSASGAVVIADVVARALVEQNIPLAAYLR